MSALRVICWSEMSEPQAVYPQGIHGAVAAALQSLGGMETRTAQLTDPEQGLDEASLRWADVLVWFSHVKDDQLEEERAARVARWVREDGLGFVALHSAFHAKPFTLLMGQACKIAGWREDGGPSKLQVVAADHPIAWGLRDFVIPQDEMYAEPFDIPPPDAVVLAATFAGGETFRAGCCWTRGQGRIFYFQPGHETYPVFFQREVQEVLVRAVEWAGKRR
jgi:trehalose utilization protein